MDAQSLFRQAEKYRLIAKGINDKTALAVLDEMALELERRARRLQARRFARAKNKRIALTAS